METGMPATVTGTNGGQLALANVPPVQALFGNGHWVTYHFLFKYVTRSLRQWSRTVVAMPKLKMHAILKPVRMDAYRPPGILFASRRKAWLVPERRQRHLRPRFESMPAHPPALLPLRALLAPLTASV